MRFTAVLAVLSCSGALASARAIPETHALHEKRDASIPRRLTKREKLSDDVKLPMRIGLKQSNLHKGHDWLMEVSDPDSSAFGQFWSQDKVIEAFQPAKDTVDQVMQWLESAGIAGHRITHSDNKQWLAFDASTKEAEDLVHAEFYEFEHSDGRALAGCDEYHIPKHLQKHIDYITPGVKQSFIIKDLKNRKRGSYTPGSHRPTAWQAPKIHWPSFPFPFSSADDLSTCDQVITPACIRALYQVPLQDPHAQVSPNNSMGIFEEGDYYDQLSLNRFFANFTPYIPQGTHPILDSIDGGYAPVSPLLDAGGESNLDFLLAIPLIYPQTTTLYQTDDEYYATGESPTATGFLNTFLDAIDGSYCTYSAYGETGDDPVLDPTYPDTHDPDGYQGQLMCGTYKPTNVISISYGEQEQDLPAYYQERQCNEYLKLGLQGVSLFVATGDTGVSGNPGDGSYNGCLRNGTVFSPGQPDSCPYITNVGATKVLPGKTVFEPESAPDDPAGHPYSVPFYSSGGFSNIFPIPNYQASAVANYFEFHNPPYPYYYNGNYENSTGLYNRNGRAYPDVAANGDNIAIYLGGNFTLEGGTSASSPIFASIVNRIIEERIKIGKGPIGFINPALYKNPWVLNDIVNGSNPGCGTQGFSCAPGWDPVTGLGTPNYPRMLSLFLALP